MSSNNAISSPPNRDISEGTNRPDPVRNMDSIQQTDVSVPNAPKPKDSTIVSDLTEQLETASIANSHPRVKSTDDQWSAQSSFATNLHIKIPSTPGMVALTPPHNPDAVFGGFRDALVNHIRLPLPYMPLAVPIHRLAEAEERWRQAEENGTKYKVPGSEVEIDISKTKNVTPNTRIITPNAQSEQSEHAFPGRTASEETTIVKEHEHGTDGLLSEDELSRYPWWKVERWNRQAAHTGWGVYIPLGVKCKFANVVWVGHRWTMEDKERYHATQQLPVCFHQGDIDSHTTVLLISVLLAHAPTTDFTTSVSGWDLVEEKFPCLYYVDCSGYRMKHVERSGLPIPSEYVDQDLLKKQCAESISNGITSRLKGAQKIDTALRAQVPATYVAKLERCLLAPCPGFHVREGKDFDDEVVAFYDAHVDCNKPLTWYGWDDLTATLDYTVKARDLWQAIADEWIPGGIIKIPLRVADQRNDDSVDKDYATSASRRDRE